MEYVERVATNLLLKFNFRLQASALLRALSFIASHSAAALCGVSSAIAVGSDIQNHRRCATVPSVEQALA